MDTNLYKKVLAGESLGKVITFAAKAETEDLERQAGELTGEEIHQFGIAASSNIRSSGVEAVLKLGFWFQLQSKLATQQECGTVFEDLLNQVGISRTQAYRAIAVWKYCAPRIVGKPGILSQFNAESLKITSSKSLPNQAREEIFERAAKGEKITIRLANQISEKFAEKTKTKEGEEVTSQNVEPASKEPTKSKRSTWSFVGSVVRLLVEPKVSGAGLKEVIIDIEKLLDQIRKKYSESVSNGPSKLGSQPSNV